MCSSLSLGRSRNKEPYEQLAEAQGKGATGGEHERGRQFSQSPPDVMGH